MPQGLETYGGEKNKIETVAAGRQIVGPLLRVPAIPRKTPLQWLQARLGMWWSERSLRGEARPLLWIATSGFNQTEIENWAELPARLISKFRATRSMDQQ